LGQPCTSDVTSKASIPVCYRPFPLWGSTGSKQTLNGLFYLIADDRIAKDFADPTSRIPELFFLSDKPERLRDEKIFDL
jgi:hypothetical protein